MVSDLGCARLLLGMGFDGLSISVAGMPRVKWAIRSATVSSMMALDRHTLRLDRAELVRRLLDNTLQDAGPERLRQSR